MTLLERLEALTGPCRECDALIGVALGWFKSEPNKGWPEKVDYIDIRGGQITYPGSGFDQLVPAYTASIDAAMTLVPEGCDKWAVSGRNAATVNERHAVVQWSYAATPAIALCIAALKVRQ